MQPCMLIVFFLMHKLIQEFEFEKVVRVITEKVRKQEIVANYNVMHKSCFCLFQCTSNTPS